MKLISLKCPECGAKLKVEQNRERLFCQYCGTEIILQNENERICRHIDEAGIKRADTERLIELKKLELEAVKAKGVTESKKHQAIIALSLFALGLIMFVVGEMLGSGTGNPNSGYYAMSCIGFFPMFGAAFIGISMIDNGKK